MKRQEREDKHFLKQIAQETLTADEQKIYDEILKTKVVRRCNPRLQELRAIFDRMQLRGTVGFTLGSPKFPKRHLKRGLTSEELQERNDWYFLKKVLYSTPAFDSEERMMYNMIMRCKPVKKNPPQLDELREVNPRKAWALERTFVTVEKEETNEEDMGLESILARMKARGGVTGAPVFPRDSTQLSASMRRDMHALRSIKRRLLTPHEQRLYDRIMALNPTIAQTDA